MLNNLEVKNYLENINIFNCMWNKEHCINENINYSPTWIIEDKVIIGNLNIEELAEISRCKSK